MPRDAPLLRRTLLKWLLVPLAFLLLTGAAIGDFVAEELANDVYNRQLLEIANELSLHVVARDGQVRLDLTPSARRLLLLDRYDEVFYRISDMDGAVLAGDAALPLPDGSLDVAVASFRHDSVRGKPVWVVATPMLAPSGAAPARLLIEVAETPNKRDKLVNRILLGMVVPQLVLILVASALLPLGVIRSLRPLRRLRQAIQDRSHRDLSPIGEEDVPGEVRPLLHAVNELMVRLDGVLSFQNRFIADAAHQLRTPVAGLKTNIEVALRETDGVALKRSLSQVYLSVERLSRLVSQLLSLARNEPGSARGLHFAPLDLERLVFNATMEWVPEAYRKSIDLGFEGCRAPVMIEGDAMRLTELVNNLVDNAIRYTREGGRVTVRITADPAPAFSVSDDGPRIPPEERERIFERFHRLLGTPADGSGLGLAIVREIATMHHADVHLTDDADGVGNRFTVIFPGERSSGGGALPRLVTALK